MTTTMPDRPPANRKSRAANLHPLSKNPSQRNNFVPSGMPIQPWFDPRKRVCNTSRGFLHAPPARLCDAPCRAAFLRPPFPRWFVFATPIAQDRVSAPTIQPLHGVDDPNRRTVTTYATAPGTGVLVFTVYAERKGAQLDRQALLKLVNLDNQSATWQTTGDTSLGVFTDLPYGTYAVDVSAVGYLSTHKEVKVADSLGPARTDIVLNRDPEEIGRAH